MTKADIAEKIQEITRLTKKESTELVDVVFSIMKDTVVTGKTDQRQLLFPVSDN